MNEDQKPKLEIDGKSYFIEDLPPHIKEMLQLFTTWEDEKKLAVREVQKLDAALKSITMEIATRVTMWQAANAMPMDGTDIGT
jgi:hypothetical protein